MAPSKKKVKIPSSTRPRHSRSMQAETSPKTPTQFINQSNTTAGAHISHLPYEIIDHIFSYLVTDIRNLLNCSTVSRTWYQVSSPRIWHHLTLSPLSSGKDDNGQAFSSGFMKDHCRIATPIKGTQYTFDAVKKLTIKHHDPQWCKGQKGKPSSFRLPNLQVLELVCDSTWKTPEFHTSHPISRTRYGGEDCRLLRNLYPTKIVFRGCHVQVNPLLIPHLPVSLFRHVEELIFISSDFEYVKPGSKMRIGSPKMLLNSLRSITWIFSPKNENKPCVPSFVEAMKFNAQALFPLVFLLDQTKHIPITVVNPAQEGIQPCGTRESVHSIKNHFFKKAAKLGLSDENIRDRWNEVNLISMENWVDDHSKWNGILDRAEVMNWKINIGILSMFHIQG
ncbi:uncharacterized protein I206_101864 [Kwoniella pini CBS 10737]|uniref:F-box domain-containing protein n=1 Tax=Kwoniella pini CBS 10737 TaxID=1296096 RepID=A0A1B9HVG7_9TREE|nr:uncharacterized protein I206_07045 [Kwoniella pini CBS 10737]OCF47267.1 hypothetical protein I206_07045 [Kwoniella pini CBS 10737]